MKKFLFFRYIKFDFILVYKISSLYHQNWRTTFKKTFVDFLDFLQFGTVFGSNLGFWWRKSKDFRIFRFFANFEGPQKFFYWADSNNFLFFENISISLVHFCNLWEYRTRLRHHTTPITYAIFEKVTFTALPSVETAYSILTRVLLLFLRLKKLLHLFS